MEEDALYEAVRAECGKIPITNTVDIENDDIDREALYIIDEIARFLPIRVLRYVPSVAGEREYEVDTNTIRVQKLYRWDTIAADLLKLGSIQASETDASEYHNFPSLWTIRQLKRHRAIKEYKFSFHPVVKKLYIDPAPQETGTKLWYISIEREDWTLEKMPSHFEKVLVTGVSWRCLEIVALRRSDLGGVIREGGFVTYPSTELKKFVDQKRDDFYAELKVLSMLHRV